MEKLQIHFYCVYNSIYKIFPTDPRRIETYNTRVSNLMIHSKHREKMFGKSFIMERKKYVYVQTNLEQKEQGFSN